MECVQHDTERECDDLVRWNLRVCRQSISSGSTDNEPLCVLKKLRQNCILFKFFAVDKTNAMKTLVLMVYIFFLCYQTAWAIMWVRQKYTVVIDYVNLHYFNTPFEILITFFKIFFFDYWWYVCLTLLLFGFFFKFKTTMIMCCWFFHFKIQIQSKFEWIEYCVHRLVKWKSSKRRVEKFFLWLLII